MRINRFLPAAAFVFFTAAILTGCTKDPQKERCDLEPEAGPCEALITKFYFDRESGECKPFDWGGCGGVVPFETLEECRECECNQWEDFSDDGN